MAEAFLDVSQAILEKANADGEKDLEKRISRLLSKNFEHKAVVTQNSMDDQLALKHCKACLTVVVGRIAGWDDPADTKELATIHNDVALSEMLINNVEEAIKTWQPSYEAFRMAEDTGPLGPTWPTIASVSSTHKETSQTMARTSSNLS